MKCLSCGEEGAKYIDSNKESRTSRRNRISKSKTGWKPEWEKKIKDDTIYCPKCKYKGDEK